jgi:hypothetical protein
MLSVSGLEDGVDGHHHFRNPGVEVDPGKDRTTTMTDRRRAAKVLNAKYINPFLIETRVPAGWGQSDELDISTLILS